jgi:hypothetical protein
MRLSKLCAAALAALFMGGGALAQGFPARSFDDLVALDLKLIKEQKKPPSPGDLFFNPGAGGAARTAASFSGQSRPIDARKQGFIIAFASTGAGNEGYARLFRREYLFSAGGKDYWLPVQDQVATYFAKELKAGQPVVLYVRNAGGFRGAQDWEWVFLVEDFQTGAGAPTPPKSAPVIPPGPKTQT